MKHLRLLIGLSDPGSVTCGASGPAVEQGLNTATCLAKILPIQFALAVDRAGELVAGAVDGGGVHVADDRNPPLLRKAAREGVGFADPPAPKKRHDFLVCCKWRGAM